MTQIIAIRPEPGLAATITSGPQFGLDITGFPLSKIENCAWQLPDLSQIDGLLIGSANALRRAGDQLAQLRQLPVFAVGEATANEAAAQGFAVEQVGEGGLQQLLDSIGTGRRTLLRLAGEAHVPLEPPPQIRLITRIVYRVVDLSIPAEMVRTLREDCIVLLHSASAAAHFADECNRLEIPRGKIVLAALGPRILEPVGVGWAGTYSASKPAESALLAMVRDMCH